MFSCVWVNHEVPIDSHISGHFLVLHHPLGDINTDFAQYPHWTWFWPIPCHDCTGFIPTSACFVGLSEDEGNLIIWCTKNWVLLLTYHHITIIWESYAYCITIVLSQLQSFSWTIHHLNGVRWLDLQFPLVHSTFVLQDGFPRKNSWFITPFEYFMICLIAIVTIVIILVINQL